MGSCVSAFLFFSFLLIHILTISLRFLVTNQQNTSCPVGSKSPCCTFLTGKKVCVVVAPFFLMLKTKKNMGFSPSTSLALCCCFLSYGSFLSFPSSLFVGFLGKGHVYRLQKSERREKGRDCFVRAVPILQLPKSETEISCACVFPLLLDMGLCSLLFRTTGQVEECKAK